MLCIRPMEMCVYGGGGSGGEKYTTENYIPLNSCLCVDKCL